MGFIINVAELMLRQFLPRPRSRCALHDDRAETLQELPIVKIRCELNSGEINDK